MLWLVLIKIMSILELCQNDDILISNYNFLYYSNLLLLKP